MHGFGVETIKWQSRAAYGCLVAAKSERQAQPTRLWAVRPLSVAQKRRHGMWLVLLYKCYMPVPLVPPIPQFVWVAVVISL